MQFGGLCRIYDEASFAASGLNICGGPLTLASSGELTSTSTYDLN